MESAECAYSCKFGQHWAGAVEASDLQVDRPDIDTSDSVSNGAIRALIVRVRAVEGASRGVFICDSGEDWCTSSVQSHSATLDSPLAIPDRLRVIILPVCSIQLAGGVVGDKVASDRRKGLALRVRRGDELGIW